MKMCRLLNCLFVSLLFVKQLFGNEGNDLLVADCYNAAAIRNLDVTIDLWQSYTDMNEASPRFEDLEETVKQRLVIDYDREVAFVVRRTVWSRSPSVPDGQPRAKGPVTALAFFTHKDGKGLDGTYGFPGKPADIPFGQFLFYHQVPNAGFCTIAGYPARHSKSGNDKLADTMAKRFQTGPDGEFRKLADGTSIASWTQDLKTHTFFFNPKYTAPIAEQWSELVDGKQVLGNHRESKLEVVKGITRLLQVDYNRRTNGLVSAEEDGSVPVRHIMTAKFTWHQFNEEQLTFPADVDKLIQDNKAMNTFLDFKAE